MCGFADPGKRITSEHLTVEVRWPLATLQRADTIIVPSTDSIDRSISEELIRALRRGLGALPGPRAGTRGHAGQSESRPGPCSQDVRTIQGAKHIHDVAKAMRVYASEQKLGREVIGKARAVTFEALRRLGEMLRDGTGPRGQAI